MIADGLIKKVWGLIERVTDGVDYSNIGKQITHKITFRYDPTISITKHRFSYDNRLFQIKGIFDMREEKFFLHAYVSEVIKHDK